MLLVHFRFQILRYGKKPNHSRLHAGPFGTGGLHARLGKLFSPGILFVLDYESESKLTVCTVCAASVLIKKSKENLSASISFWLLVSASFSCVSLRA